MITTIWTFILRNLNLMKYIGIGIVVLFIAYKGYSFYSGYQKLIEERDRTLIELKSTKLELSKAVMVANQNAKELQDEKERTKKTIDVLEENHKIELEKKKTYTIIKERTYYEKDSDFISPVLRNTIDRLYPKAKS